MLSLATLAVHRDLIGTPWKSVVYGTKPVDMRDYAVKPFQNILANRGNRQLNLFALALEGAVGLAALHTVISAIEWMVRVDIV
jgi:hypothetical protein